MVFPCCLVHSGGLENGGCNGNRRDFAVEHCHGGGPMALFVLLALFAPLVYRRIAGKLIEKFRPHQPQWISIILDSYLRPTTILLRAVFIYAALWVLPLELNTPTYRSVLARIMQVTAICLIAWGAWMAAPVCRLLLRSAENKLDIATNRTNGALFLKISSELL